MMNVHPCGSCPYRRDVPAGVWAEEEYAKLPAYDLPTAQQPWAAFFCHQRTGDLCAGWVGCHDMDDSLSLRMAVIQRVLEPEDAARARAYVSPIPLFESGQAAAAHGLSGIAAPSARAVRVATRLQRKLR